jgi:hypothetical protein
MLKTSTRPEPIHASSEERSIAEAARSPGGTARAGDRPAGQRRWSGRLGDGLRPTSSTSLPAPVVTTTTVVEEAPNQPEDATPVELDLSGVNLGNANAVAAAWGCGYWAHPPGETAEGLAQRLAPVATPEMTAAVAELRMPDFGADVVEVYPGAVERTSKMTYTIGCRSLTAGPDGAPAGGALGDHARFRPRQ